MVEKTSVELGRTVSHALQRNLNAPIVVSAVTILIVRIVVMMIMAEMARHH